MFESERILGLRLMECCDTSVLKDNLFTFFPYMFLYLPLTYVFKTHIEYSNIPFKYKLCAFDRVI